MNKGLFEELEITQKMPNNKTSYEERYLGNLFINAGYVTDAGKMAKVELRSMLRLIDLADYCHRNPSYKWHALNLVVKKLPENNALYLDQENSRWAYGEEFDVGTYLTDLFGYMKRAVSRPVILYRWHPERSSKGGFHAHVTLFINGSGFGSGGVKALMASRSKLRNSNKKDYQLVSLTFNEWNRARESKEAKEYFDGLGYELSYPEPTCIEDVDAPLLSMTVKRLEDLRYVLYVASYQTKFYTKEYEEFKNGTSIGFHSDELHRWSNGTTVQRDVAANYQHFRKAA